MNSVSIRVNGADQAGEARRAAAAVAKAIGFDEAEAGSAALVATECANNLWRHGGGGEVLLTPIGGDSDPGMEILALDKGPGIPNPERSFQDGYSTAGSAGLGLGAVRRLASEVDLYTVPDRGTALLARLRKRRRPGTHKGDGDTGLEVGGVSVALRGEEVCGDDWAVREAGGRSALLVVDGLGHGLPAAQSAAAATEAFEETRAEEPVEILAAAHDALRPTRGAAVAAAVLDSRRREVRYAGIGNISGIICTSARTTHMVSQPGIVGHNTRRVREFTYPWPVDALVLLYSDGIATHWSLDAYPGLAGRDPSIIAGIIYRDWNRGRDDATVVVVRERPEA